MSGPVVGGGGGGGTAIAGSSLVPNIKRYENRGRDDLPDEAQWRSNEA